MSEFIMAQNNGRTIPLEDKVFGISRMAKEMIAERGKDAVVNSTLGALLDDNGNLVVLSSVVDVLKNLAPEEYAEYAPIGGTPEFKKYVKKAAFGNYEPKSFTEAVATPGGTGAIRNAVYNYSKQGDDILTTDWHWANYNSIADETGRRIVNFELFDNERKFNTADFEKKVKEILDKQESLVVILNTPAHNPTGYSFTIEDWNNALGVIKKYAAEDKKIVIIVDVAYIDFAGDSEKYREFIPLLDELPANILPIMAYSLSKTFTLYGMRCAAMICMAKTKEIAEEFVRVNQYSARAAWSNCTRAAMVVLSRIYEDEKLLKKVNEEREHYRDILMRRGKAFEDAAEKAGLEIVPFDSGFFVSVPCENSDEVAAKLREEGIFLIPLAKGLRVSVASVKEEICRMLPAKIKAAME